MNRDDVELPYLDEHRLGIAAPRDLVWAALMRYVASLGVSEGGPLARLLGTEPRTGFAVSRAVPGQQLNLSGRHRFARYTLVFEVAEVPDGQTVLCARSYADFPGLHGRAYRALVIGTRFHVVATRRLLRSIRRLVPEPTRT